MSAKRWKNPGSGTKRRLLPNSIRRVRLEPHFMMRLVGALQMQFRQQSTNTLSVKEFDKLFQKIQKNDSSCPRDDDLKDLSESEQALYQVLAVAPLQYRLKQQDSVSYLHKVCEDKELLSRLQGCTEVTWSNEQHQETLRILRLAARQQEITSSQNKKRPRDEETKSEKLQDVPAIVTADMNLDERVKARHEAKLRRLQDDGTSSSVDTKAMSNERALRAADTLWSLSHTYTHPFSLLLKDAVQRVSGGMILSKREALDVLLELEQIAPEWIQWEAGTSGKESQDASLWLKKIDYTVLRSRISGKPMTKKASAFQTPKQSTAKTAIVTHSSAKRFQPLSTYASRLRAQNSQSKTKSGQAVAAAATPEVSVENLRPSLRINHGHILMEADRHGGQSLDISKHSSPRGLRNLFLRMNDGHRI